MQLVYNTHTKPFWCSKSTIYLLFFHAEPPFIANFEFPSETVNEGTFAQIICSVVTGDEPLTIAWSLHGDTISSDPDIITTSLGTRSSILTISKVGYRHAGDYTCRASNIAGSYSHTAKLSVNG